MVTSAGPQSPSQRKPHEGTLAAALTFGHEAAESMPTWKLILDA